ncbi:AAC(3) family N-acetyltransferase [Mycetohabitans rhizoxinica]|uniref:AAC(3) family N-acetyltransferase n=1 Tax=Mycetohabitans rhizoxinica TaxID=412963 RepID=UPI0030CBC60D
MTEHNLILKTPAPRTRSSLARQLAEGGVTAGSTILVHSSLSSLGWVAGAAVAVIQALMDCIGPNGTLVMPTHTAHLDRSCRMGSAARALQLGGDPARGNAGVRSGDNANSQYGCRG